MNQYQQPTQYQDHSAAGAVVRNRLKRLTRESFRLTLPSMAPGRTVIVTWFKSAAEADSQTARESLDKAWHKAGLREPLP